MEHPAPLVPGQFLGLEAEDALNARAHVADGAIGLEDTDDVDGVLNQGAEMVLPQCRLQPLALDRGRKHVGYRLEEPIVVGGEMPAGSVVHP